MARPQWMQPAKIRQLYGLGWSNAAIAEANRDETGWRPSRSAMSRKLRDLGMPPRRTRHGDLIPWRINPEHAHDPIYYGLQAISRERQGIKLDLLAARSEAKMLRDLLTSGSTPMVVDYDYDKGWRLVRARKTDTDIIRRPKPVETGHDDGPS